MRLLVVEDQPDVARFIKRGLEEMGFAVDHARDGQEALAYVEGVAYDLITLDVMLPDFSGHEVCRTIRGGGVKAPVLMLTARGAVDDRVDGLDCGADDYLAKPFAFAELLARIRALTRRPALSDELRTHDLVLNTAAREVWRSGKSVRLSNREFAILELLMRRPGCLISQEAIVESVWSFDMDPSSNVVEVHMSSLRRKIDDPFQPPLLQTVRGAGYRIRAPDRE